MKKILLSLAMLSQFALSANADTVLKYHASKFINTPEHQFQAYAAKKADGSNAYKVRFVSQKQYRNTFNLLIVNGRFLMTQSDVDSILAFGSKLSSIQEEAKTMPEDVYVRYFELSKNQGFTYRFNKEKNKEFFYFQAMVSASDTPLGEEYNIPLEFTLDEFQSLTGLLKDVQAKVH